MTRGANGHGSPRTKGSHWMIPSPGRHGAGMYELRSGMARMSGDDGVWPIGPAAKPANPAPSESSPSTAETGTILAQGLPCMSTNMAKRKSTPSRSVASLSSAAVVGVGPVPVSVLTVAVHLPLCVSAVCRSSPDSTMLPHGKPAMVTEMLRNVACPLTAWLWTSGTPTARAHQRIPLHIPLHCFLTGNTGTS